MSPDSLLSEDKNLLKIIITPAEPFYSEIYKQLFELNLHDCVSSIPNQQKESSLKTPNKGDEWNVYYDYAEPGGEWAIRTYIGPMINKYDINTKLILDFPSGRGRIAEALFNAYKNKINKIICCDANNEAINISKKRFENNTTVDSIVNKVNEYYCHPLPLSDKKFTFIYSWDSLVHFSYKWLDYYISEFYRLLEHNGYVLIHHSNLSDPNVKTDSPKNEYWDLNTHKRSFINAGDIEFISKKHGFSVVEQKFIDWGTNPKFPNLDCITLLKK